jgi:hypothetical protein
LIKYFLNNRASFIVVSIHIALGILSTFSRYVLIGWMGIGLLMEIQQLFDSRNLNFRLNRFIVYFSSFEVLARMAGCTPFIPYEFGKYFLFVSFLYGIYSHYRKGYIGWLMVALLIPAIVYDFSETVSFENLVFNVLGPINIGLGVVYFKEQSVSQQHLNSLIKLALLPAISVLSYAFFKTPDYDTIEFGLSANFDTTGGFGSNQVSTVLGLGFFLYFLLWITEQKLSGYRIMDLGIMLAFLLQGLLTFSRGGVLGGLAGILCFLLVTSIAGVTYSNQSQIKLSKISIYVIPTLIAGLLVFQFVDNLTNNALTMRYKGETAGTVAGSKEVDLNTMTSNRYDVFIGDIELWEENFITGVGVGASKDLRLTTEETPTAAHVEISRLLAEHGMFGLIYFIILCFLPVYILKQNRDALNRGILLSLFVLGFFSSFHAATRTYVTPLLVSMSLVTITENKQKKTTAKPIIHPI